MALKVFNMQGGNHSPAALSAFLDAAFDGEVADGLTIIPGSGNSITVKPGAGQIRTGQGFSRLIQVDANETVQLGAASPSNARNTLIVAFIDMNVQTTTSVVDNTNGVLKLRAVQGVPSSAPQDPSNSSIQSLVGAGNPFIILARVKQRAGSSSVISSDITDLRKLVTIKDGRVTADKIDFASVNKYSTEERIIGEWIDDRPVYQKTFDITVDFKQNQYTNVPHGISGITGNFVVVSVQSAGAIGRTSGAVDRMIPRIEWQHQAGLIAVEKDNLVFASSWPWGRSRVILTIQYVK